MVEAAVVATARNPISKTYPGAFNDAPGQHFATPACVGGDTGATGLLEVAFR